MKQKIIPPRRTPQVNPSEVWPRLHSAFRDILRLDHSQWSYSQLYNTVYNLVLARHAQFVYDGIGNDIADFLKEDVRARMVQLMTRDSQNMDVADQGKVLKQVVAIWDNYLLAIKLISYVSLYLDRTYVKENKMASIYDQGLNIFRDIIIDSSIDIHSNDLSQLTIGEKLIQLVMHYYKKARMGEFIDRSLLKSSIEIFEVLIEPKDNQSYYKKHFESSFLLDSHKYYIFKAKDLLNSHGGSLYVSNSLEFIKHEISLQTLHISEETIPTLQTLLFQDLILTPMPDVLDDSVDGLSHWVTTDDYESLKNAYILIKKCQPNQEILRIKLRKLIIDMGNDIISQSWDNSQIKPEDGNGSSNNTGGSIKVKFVTEIVTNFISIRNQFLTINTKSFGSDGNIGKEIDDAFMTIINESDYEPRNRRKTSSSSSSSEGRFQEYLSLYIDSVIKRPQENIDSQLDSAIDLLRYVKDKDIFEKYYRNHLARRLLNTNNTKKYSEEELDLEIGMITKLQNDNGSSFTTLLEGMIKDIKSSQTISNEFQEFKCEGFFKPMVLTNAYWPNKPLEITNLPLPQEMSSAKDEFEEWYGEKYPGRNIKWYNAGHVVVACKSMIKTKEGKIKYKNVDVQMPTMCGMILGICFGDDDDSKKISIQEIQESTKIEMNDLLRHIYGLISGKTKLLTIVDKNETLDPETLIKCNVSWKCKEPKAKVLVPGSLPKSITSKMKAVELTEATTTTTSTAPLTSSNHLETASEHLQTLDSIHNDRAHNIDAAIARIMKSRRQLKHQELVMEVMRMVKSRFEPKTSLIKERIGELIDMEYIKRNDDGGYEYLA